MAHKNKTPPYEIRITDPEVAGTATYLLPHSIVYTDRDWYVAIGTNRRLGYFDHLHDGKARRTFRKNAVA